MFHRFKRDQFFHQRPIQHLTRIEQQHPVLGAEVARQHHARHQLARGAHPHFRVQQGDVTEHRRTDLHEILQQAGVIHPPGILAKVEQCFVTVQRALENQAALQFGEVHRKLEQAGAKGNGFALELVREAATVPVLLVMQDQAGGVLHRVQGHEQRLALARIVAVPLAIGVGQQVRRGDDHAVGPAHLADVVQRGRHGQVAAGRFIHVVRLAVVAHQLDDLPVGLLGRGQAQVGQHREHLGAGDIAVLELFVGQVEHVGRLLQFGGAGLHPFFQVQVQQFQLRILLACQHLQALAFPFGVLVLQGLAQRQEHFVVVPGLADVAMDTPFVHRLDDGRGVGVAGQHDPGGRRVALVHLRQQGGTVHRRHARVTHHQVHRLTRHDLQGLFATAGQQHVIRLAAQQPAQAVEDGFLVVDKQYRGALPRGG